jgi:hypothetical protein
MILEEGTLGLPDLFVTLFDQALGRMATTHIWLPHLDPL